MALYCTAGTDSRAGWERSAAAYPATLTKEIARCSPASTMAQHPLPGQKGCQAALLHAMPWLADTTKSISLLKKWKKDYTNHRKSLCVTVCNRLQTSAPRSKELRDGLVLMTKIKKLNLCSFLHLVKEIMHFPQSLMAAPQGLYYYLLFCLLK